MTRELGVLELGKQLLIGDGDPTPASLRARTPKKAAMAMSGTTMKARMGTGLRNKAVEALGRSGTSVAARRILGFHGALHTMRIAVAIRNGRMRLSMRSYS